MAKDETKRVRPITLQDDRDAFSGIKAISDYNPANKAYTVDKLQALQDAMVAKRDTEVQKQNEAEAARDDTVSAEWAFHNAMLAVKDQVKAQYGDDSDQYAAIGRTKSSERQSPTRTSGGQSTPAPGQ